MKKIALFLFFISMLIINSCKPDPPVPAPEQLPPITQTGANTFGCLVDGEVWLPESNLAYASVTAEYSNGYISIDAHKPNSVGYQTLILSLSPIRTDTTLAIHNSNQTQSFQFFLFNDVATSSSNYMSYEPIGNYTGEIHISKLDSINHIISGTFWFDAIDTTTNKVVQIRDGRFDVKPF